MILAFLSGRNLWAFACRRAGVLREERAASAGWSRRRAGCGGKRRAGRPGPRQTRRALRRPFSLPLGSGRASPGALGPRLPRPGLSPVLAEDAVLPGAQQRRSGKGNAGKPTRAIPAAKYSLSTGRAFPSGGDANRRILHLGTSSRAGAFPGSGETSPAEPGSAPAAAARCRRGIGEPGRGPAPGRPTKEAAGATALETCWGEEEEPQSRSLITAFNCDPGEE